MEYRPSGRILERFRASDAFVRGIRGPIGSGKSTACVAEVLRRAAMQRPGPDGKRRSRWAIIRNTFPELKTTTIKTWQQWVPAHLGRFQGEGPPTHWIAAGELDMEVMFLALDRPEDIRKLLSLELTGAWINEAREVPKAILDALTGRVGRFPSAMQGGASWYGIMMDTNPPDTDHWWYRLAEEERPKGWDFFAQPAGDGPDAENLRNLPRGYYERAVAGKDEDWIRVYVRGDYGFVRDGKPVIPEYRDTLHCRPVQPSPKLPITIGIDFGLTPAAMFEQRLPNGRVIWFDELATQDMGARRFGELLVSKIQRDYAPWADRVEAWGDPAGEGRSQADESTAFQMLAAVGMVARPCHTNDPTVRREAIAAPLSRIVDGEPGLVIDPKCVVARKGLIGGYCYRRLAVVGQERYRDAPDKNIFSHSVEAGGYGMLGLGEGRSVLKRPAHMMGRAFQVPATSADWNPLA